MLANFPVAAHFEAEAAKLAVGEEAAKAKLHLLSPELLVPHDFLAPEQMVVVGLEMVVGHSIAVGLLETTILDGPVLTTFL